MATNEHEVGHDQFLPYPFQFTACQSLYFSTLNNPSCLSFFTSLSQSQKNKPLSTSDLRLSSVQPLHKQQYFVQEPYMMQSLWGSFRLTKHFNIQSDKRERNYCQGLSFVKKNGRRKQRKDSGTEYRKMVKETKKEVNECIA